MRRDLVVRVDLLGALGSPFLYEGVSLGDTNGGWPPMRQPPAGDSVCRVQSGRGDYLHRSGDLAAPDATGANPHPARGLVYQDLYGLEIGHPATLASIVGMANMVAGGRPFAADCADACHLQLQDQASSLVTAHKDSCQRQLRQGSPTPRSCPPAVPLSPPKYRSPSRCLQL